MMRNAIMVLLVASVSSSAVAAPIYLSADGRTDTYALINRTFGGKSVEPPDCSHSSFGPHIRQEPDSEIGKPVFVFHIHSAHDNDRCINFDRQRNEIKTYDKSADYLKGFNGNNVVYRWRFKLDSGFQSSPRFTHIHQIKAVDGDDQMPIVTLTARAGSPEKLELIHVDSVKRKRQLSEVALAEFKGAWIDAHEKITYGPEGKYSLTLTRARDGAVLLSYTSERLDMWRKGASFVRPKWGIYRSLEKRSDLRDEALRFDGFCLAKASDDCPMPAPLLRPDSSK